MTADWSPRVIRYVQARGNDTRELRDAAHEAHHALYTGLRKPWTRDNIHAAVLRIARKQVSRVMPLPDLLVRQELNARAVEWIVCERAGLEYDAPKWADVMWWETFKNMNIRLPDVEEVQAAITIAKGRPTIVRAAEAVIALADKPLRDAWRLPTAAEPAR